MVAMAVVGIVFSVPLQDTDLGTLLPWVNFVVHYCIGMFVLFLLVGWALLALGNRLPRRVD